jgi:2-dehydro-3-deoxyphosphogluconate aldolase / (4S)-4-hydroxy-2-oxoglutarate aldolase
MDAAESNAWFDRSFAGRPLMAIFRGLGVERTLELAATAWEIGIPLVEIPLQSPEDVDALVATVELASQSGRFVAAGTVLTREHVHQAIAAGASFAVSPGLDEEIVAECLAAGIPTLPGVATASEVQHATRLGLEWVKVFPAAVLGASWFGAMRGPFPAAKFVATGGLDASSAQQFLDAGASVVAVGSAIANGDELQKLADLIARAQ